ncbi:helix-hairpin-helix domain-containing protein [Frigoribacterium sp. CG_9.8]|uniref:ComEA family DNA-binding protein n=1 Tax=Frigoribacterium sp. CG_9.8 TaxID=2787733 RepID=UPI0018C9BE6A|nr:helix-hairpin-helix domain-containing protein [Frigoribacterium sp. CG_9.8]MBG6107328.1 competence protein ComEA [Frigoribacterium sp. CG_9.8]
MEPPAALIARRSVRARVGVGAAVVLVLLGLGIAVLVSAFGSHGSSQSVTPPALAATPGASGAGRSGTGAATIYIHILGAVAKPGLYLLRDGDRALDAAAAAGGFNAAADQSGLNLARLLVDGEQIYVPTIGGTPAVTPGVSAVGGKVNINTADQTALETLPRVGPAMAKRIIDWRTTNGRFTALEDLMSVTGVGEKTFDSLKDLVTL